MVSGNAQKYCFDDFTQDNYRRLLQLAKQHYTFLSYDNLPTTEKILLLRHDLDFSVHAACRLARIEAEEGIKSTYFLLLHSEFYNLLEKEVSDCVREIMSYGHRIGLHFDPTYYGIEDEDQLIKHLQFEKTIIENLFSQPINAFSFHITSPFTARCEQWQYADMINVYAHYFKQIGYCSDSNGYWRHQRLEDVLRAGQHKQLQVLIHPEYWPIKVSSPRERVMRCIEGRAQKTQQWYQAILAKHNREDIDW